MMDVSTDEFAGTVYRELADATAAVEYATFLANNDIGQRTHDRALAIDEIDKAVRALDQARAQLVSEQHEVSVEMDRQLRAGGRLDLAALEEFEAAHRRR